MTSYSTTYAKLVQLAPSRAWRYCQQSDGYLLWLVSPGLCVESCISDPDDISDFESKYKTGAQAVPSRDDAYLESDLSQPRASDGSPVAAITKKDGPKITLITPNWCDRCTWYQGSVYVEDEVAQDSGDHTTYNLTYGHIIDTYHGRITFEDFLKDSEDRSYRVVVKVNDVVKSEQDPHLGTGGDYTINYETGSVTFLSALQPSDVVKVTYHYADSSVFTIKPLTGKRLIVNQVEVQFSADTEMKDSVMFQAWGPVDVFAPYLMEPPYNYPSGTMIPLGDPLIYKTIADLINDSNHAYPAYPAMGGSGWRSLSQAAYIFAWDYNVGSTVLPASLGMEIRVSLQHDEENAGSFATATFYCTSENE